MVRKLVRLIDNVNVEARGPGADGLVRGPSAASACGLDSEKPLRTAEIA